MSIVEFIRKNIASWCLLMASIILIPIIAQASTFNYEGAIRVYNNGTEEYTYMPLLASINNTQMINLAMMSATGMDTNLEEGSSNIVYSVADVRLGMYLASLTSGQTRNYSYQMGYSPAKTTIPILVGRGGYVELADVAGMKAGDIYGFILDGMFDTRAEAGSGVYKPESFVVYSPSVGQIRASMLGASSYVSPSGVTDPESGWANETNTRDGGTGTSATATVAAGSWSEYLYYTCPAGAYGGIELYATYNVTKINQVEIGVRSTLTEWVDFYSGVFDNESWDINFTPGVFKDAELRVRFYNTGAGPETATFHEIKGGVINPTISASQACSSGEHIVTIWSGGSVFHLDIDGTEVTTLLDFADGEPAHTAVLTPSADFDENRNIWYAEGLFWVFYSDSYFRTSSDLVSWSALTNYGSWDETSVWYDGTYFHFLAEHLYRRGEPSSLGTISWSTDWQEVLTYDFDWYDNGDIVTDTDGYPWIAIFRSAIPYGSLRAYKSSTKDGTFTIDASVTKTFSTNTGAGNVCLVPLPGGEMYTIGQQTASTWGIEWNGPLSGWGSSEDLLRSSLGRYYSNDYSWSSGVADVDGNVYVVGSEEITNSILFQVRDPGGTVGPVIQINRYGLDSNGVPNIGYLEETNEVIIVWANNPTDEHIYYARYDCDTQTFVTNGIESDYIYQDLMGGDDTNQVNSGVRYLPLVSGGDPVSTTTYVAYPFPVAGDIDNLRVKFEVAPGVGKSWTLKLRRAGSGNHSSTTTAIGCIVSGTSTEGSDLLNWVNVEPGDTIYLEVSPSGTPTACKMWWSVRFKSREASKSIVSLCVPIAMHQTNTQYYPLMSGQVSTNALTASQATQVIPTNGTLDYLEAFLSTAPGSGNDYVITLYVNGAPTGVTATISGTATSGSDLIHNQSVSAGDLVYYQVVPVSTPSSSRVNIGMRFTADVDGESIVMTKSLDIVDNVTTEYTQASGSYTAFSWTSTELNTYQMSGGSVLKNLYVYGEVAPGAGNSNIVTLRKEGVPTSLTCTLNDAENVDSDLVNEVTVSAGERLSLEHNPDGNPTMQALSISFVSYQPLPTDVVVYRYDWLDESEVVEGERLKIQVSSIDGILTVGWAVDKLTDEIRVSTLRLGGAGSGPDDNSNSWYFMGSTVPYLDYIYYEVSGVEKLLYSPNTLISATNLPDRSGNGNTGTIFWGENPSEVEVTLENIVAAGYTPPQYAAGDPPVVLPPVPGFPLFEDSTETGAGFPMYDSVERMAVSMDMTVPDTYSILFILIAIVVGIASMVSIGTIWGFIIGFGITSGALFSTGAGAPWIGYTCVGFAVFLGYVSRNV